MEQTETREYDDKGRIYCGHDTDEQRDDSNERCGDPGKDQRISKAFPEYPRLEHFPVIVQADVFFLEHVRFVQAEWDTFDYGE